MPPQLTGCDALPIRMRFLVVTSVPTCASTGCPSGRSHQPLRRLRRASSPRAHFTPGPIRRSGVKSRCYFARKAGAHKKRDAGCAGTPTGASQLNPAMRLAATAGARARWAAADGLYHYARPGLRDHPADGPARARHGPGRASADHALVGELDPADWLRPAECTGWSVRDVVAHMIGGNEELSRPVRLIRRVGVGGAVERAGPQVGEGPVAVVITVGDGEAVPLPVPDRDTVPPALLPSLA